MKKTISFFNETFTAGLLTAIPLAAVILVIQWIYKILYKVAVYLKINLLPLPKGVTSLLVLIGLVGSIFLIGLLSKFLLFKKLLGIFENLVGKLPGLNIIYRGAQQITLTLLKNMPSEARVVLVELPKINYRILGFITAPSIKVKGEEHVGVFIPTTPNPTSGFFVIVPKKRVKKTDISFQDALKLIASAGIIGPKNADRSTSN